MELINPKDIKQKVSDIRKKNNVSEFSNKDLLLYVIHNQDSMKKDINDNSTACAKNMVSIGWNTKGMMALYGIIGAALTALIVSGLGVI